SNVFVVNGLSYDYALRFDAGTPETGSKRVDGCALGVEPWRSTVVPTEAAPTGTAVAPGAMRMLKVPTATGFEAVPVQAISVGSVAVVWADVSATHPANLDPVFV